MRYIYLFTILALPLQAQIRIYDAKAGRNVEAGSISPTLPRETFAPQGATDQVSTGQVMLPKPARHKVGSWTPSGTYVGRDLLENEVYLPRGADDPIRTEVGEVYVFTTGVDFSPVVAERLNEIKRIPGIEPIFYLNDMAPEAYFVLLQKGFDKLRSGVELVSDGGDRQAARLGVTNANVIVFKAASGVLRQYNLLTEIDTFRNALERVRYEQQRDR